MVTWDQAWKFLGYSAKVRGEKGRESKRYEHLHLKGFKREEETPKMRRTRIPSDSGYLAHLLASRHYHPQRAEEAWFQLLLGTPWTWSYEQGPRMSLMEAAVCTLDNVQLRG